MAVTVVAEAGKLAPLVRQEVSLALLVLNVLQAVGIRRMGGRVLKEAGLKGQRVWRANQDGWSWLTDP